MVMKLLFSKGSMIKAAIFIVVTLTVGSTPVMGQLSATITGPNGSLCAGANYTLNFTCAVAGNTGPLTYTWIKNGGQNIGQGSNLSSFSTNLLGTGDKIKCFVSSSGQGTVFSNEIQVPTLTQPEVFGVSISVSSTTVCTGSSVTFTANSDVPMSSPFVWREINTGIQVQGGNTFTIPATSVADLQSVTVSATAASGACVQNTTANSNASALDFTILPLSYPSVSLTQNLSPVSIGTPVTFTAARNDGGSGTPVYTWQLNGATVPGVYGNTFTTTLFGGTDIQSVTVSMNPSLTCPQNAAVATSNFMIISSDWENLNYIREQDILVPGVTSWQAIDNLPIGQKRERTNYLDGLGRSIQKLDKSGSLANGTSSDLVLPVVYDARSRNAQQYLPYVTADNPGKFKSANVLTQQASFVTGKFGEPSNAPTYAQVAYDNSPLNRITTSYAAGQSWGGSLVGVSANYDFNDASELVHIWDLPYSAGAIPGTSPAAVYPTGTLYRFTSTDENGKSSVTYTDVSGKTILQKSQVADVGNGLTGQHAGWACTYYVYNDLGELQFTIPPKAVELLDNKGWDLTQQMVNDLCFVSQFDAKGREISKKRPGIGETNIIYDRRDEPVYSQDPNGQVKDQWLATLYDGMGRVVETGMLQLKISPSALQSSVDANTGVVTIVGGGSPSTDIVISGQQNGVTQYVATNSITFDNFQSDDGGSLETYINPAMGPGIPEALAVANNTIPPGGNIIPLTLTFYDDYSAGTKTYTTADNSKFDPSTNQQALPLPGQYDPQTRGAVTVTEVKVITNPSDLTQGNWLETDRFYDNQGRILQTQSDNFLGGTEIVTNRFDFSGKLWGDCVKHMAGNPTEFTVVSKNSYDALGRLTNLSKNFNNSFFKDIASYSYDEYGMLSKKILAPNYTGSGKLNMEQLVYDYNIRGWLTGINKDYALDQNVYDQWNSYFGISLGYDNSDNQFVNKRLDGRLTGSIWKSQGDNSVRKYDYTYDNLGRFTGASFQQRVTPIDNWSNSAVDLSETVGYADGNGNIATMKRMGIVPGRTGGVTIDDLHYTYGTVANPNVNLLTKVDESSGFAGDGQYDDFKKGSTPSGSADYVYDANGNVIQDQNKEVTDGGTGGVVYNYLNKPVSITVAGKSLVQYTYDAAGDKLSKSVTNLAVSPNTTSTTTYDGEFVYKDNSLLYVLHEEGRLKIITPINSPQQQLNAGDFGVNNAGAGKQGVFEYFVKDQLSNVRMVLTEEVQSESYVATMETSSASDPNLGTDEAKLFGNVDPSTGNPAPDKEVDQTRTATGSTPWTGNTSGNVSQLSAAVAGKTIGPNMLLKVSAGDMIDAGANYFYYANDPAGPSYSGGDAVASLIAALIGGNISPLAESNSALISANLGVPTSDYSSFINKYYNASSPAPKAFLNVLFFDEQFNFIGQDVNAPGVGTNLAQVSSPNDQNAAPLNLMQKAPRNGWVYIYLSNESNQTVYFDNLSVSQVHSNISEENHYYAFGQKVTGISTIAFNKLDSRYRYQGDYSQEEENTGWNEFGLRMYDRQLGRWTGVDPFDQFANPYIGMGNDPVNNTDPTGGDVGDEFMDLAESLSDGGEPRLFNALTVARQYYPLGGYCNSCETVENAEWLKAVAVRGRGSILTEIKQYIRDEIDSRIGLLVGAAKSAHAILITAARYSPDPSVRLQIELEYGPTDPMEGLNSAANFGDMLTDRSGNKQKKYFTNLFHEFQYGTSFENSQRVGKLAPTVAAIMLTGNPGIATEGSILEETGAGLETTTVEEQVDLYRNFGPNELESIKANGGKFSIHPNQFQGKQFWVGEDGLNMWTKSRFSKPYTAKITIPKSFVTPGSKNYIFMEPDMIIDGFPGGTVLSENLQQFNDAMRILWIRF